MLLPSPVFFRVVCLVAFHATSACATSAHWAPATSALFTSCLSPPSLSCSSHAHCSALSTSSSGSDVSGSSNDVSGNDPTVDPHWLKENLAHVQVLDASWNFPTEKRVPFADYQSARIPGALFFDIEAISDQNTTLPHMLPERPALAAALSALGLPVPDGQLTLPVTDLEISQTDARSQIDSKSVSSSTNQELPTVVVYDTKGLFSAARAWWMLRVIGYPSSHVRVLSGGLPAWQKSGFEVESGPLDADTLTKVEGARKVVKEYYQSEKGLGQPSVFSPLVVSIDRVIGNLPASRSAPTFQLVDARSKGRYTGDAPEPRPNTPSGHIPGSRNIPFMDVLTSAGELKSTEELKDLVKGAGVSLDRPIVASCATGVTACVVALALHKLGATDVPVFDGSWVEWTSTEGAPIAKGEST